MSSQSQGRRGFHLDVFPSVIFILTPVVGVLILFIWSVLASRALRATDEGVVREIRTPFGRFGYRRQRRRFDFENSNDPAKKQTPTIYEAWTLPTAKEVRDEHVRATEPTSSEQLDVTLLKKEVDVRKLYL